MRAHWRWLAVDLVPIALGGWRSLKAFSRDDTEWIEVKRDDVEVSVEVTLPED